MLAQGLCKRQICHGKTKNVIKEFMKNISMLLNFVNILLIGWLTVELGDYLRPGNFIVLIFLIITPTVTLFTLLTNGDWRQSPAGDWLSLFLRRKALEEQIKINLLNRK